MRRELFCEFIAPRTGGTQQDHNIRIAYRTETARSIRDLLALDHAADLLRDHRCLQLLCIVRTRFVKRLCSAVRKQNACPVGIHVLRLRK